MSRRLTRILLGGLTLAVAVSFGLGGCTGSNDDDKALLVRSATPAAGGAFEKVYALAAADGVSLPQSGLQEGETVKLRVFHFNDLHSKHVVPHARRGDTRYFAQMVKRVRAARQAAGAKESVLFLSAGDDHIGEVYDELLGSDVASFVMSLPYRAYSAAGVDAVVLGNHEFDKGTGILARMIEADARFPVLSANVKGSRLLSPAHVSPAIIGTTKGVRVGIVGLTTPAETKTGFAEDPALGFAGVLATLKNLMPALVQETDVVIVLSHVGFNGGDPSGARHVIAEGDVEIARYLATLGKPALVIGGHTHTALNVNGLDAANVVDGVPVLQAGAWGSHLGEVEIDVTRTAGKVAITVRNARLHALKRRDIRVPPDAPNFAAFEQDSDVDVAFHDTVIAPMMARLAERLALQLGVTTGNPDMGAAATIADRYKGESAIANFMNDAVLERSATFPGGKVDLVAFNASAIITGVPLNSPLTFSDWYAVMPFADIIRIIEMSGQQIHDMLQSNAARVVRDGEAVDLNGFVSRGFLHFSRGLRYRIRLGADANAARAENIELLGKPIETVLNQKYRVAFGDYIANGNEGWRGAPILAGLPAGIIGYDLRALDDQDTGFVYRNEIIAFIKAKGVVGADTGAAKDGRVTLLP
jgi:2',3'-cyclic-nucleotide 2'-phosphodiesterase (5'-nucleotidase family)